MANLDIFSKKTMNHNGVGTVNPGVYHAKIIDVTIDQRYVDEALVLTHELKDGDKVRTFTDRYIKNPRFDRTRKFDKYLKENGIYSVEDLLGLNEMLDLRWNFTRTGKRELTVFDRTFIGFTDEEEYTEDNNESVVKT